LQKNGSTPGPAADDKLRRLDLDDASGPTLKEPKSKR
jgi:hypothetical protein